MLCSNSSTHLFIPLRDGKFLFEAYVLTKVEQASSLSIRVLVRLVKVCDGILSVDKNSCVFSKVASTFSNSDTILVASVALDMANPAERERSLYERVICPIARALYFFSTKDMVDAFNEMDSKTIKTSVIFFIMYLRFFGDILLNCKEKAIFLGL